MNNVIRFTDSQLEKSLAIYKGNKQTLQETRKSVNADITYVKNARKDYDLWKKRVLEVDANGKTALVKRQDRLAKRFNDFGAEVAILSNKKAPVNEGLRKHLLERVVKIVDMTTGHEYGKLGNRSLNFASLEVARLKAQSNNAMSKVENMLKSVGTDESDKILKGVKSWFKYEMDFWGNLDAICKQLTYEKAKVAELNK